MPNDTIDGTTITTATGSGYDLAVPETWDGDLRSVVRGLSNICRFGGQITRFYSVAEHSVHVEALVARYHDDPELRLAALLHDAHEAFYGDIVKPLKPMATCITERMAVFDLVLARRLRIPSTLFGSDFIRAADELMLRREAWELWAPPPVWAQRPPDRATFCWPPHVAARALHTRLLECLEAAGVRAGALVGWKP